MMDEIMCVKELEALLENIPDDYLVYSCPINRTLKADLLDIWKDAGKVYSLKKASPSNAIVLIRGVE